MKTTQIEKANLTKAEARFLVDSYYTIQDYRKTAANQIRAATPEHEQPSEVLTRFFDEYERIEHDIKKELDRWTDTTPVGLYMKSITGIGPVITAGILAHVDIERAPSVSNLWSYAGQNPEAKWPKGEKRPWNARLKVICWHAGESFVKFQNNPNDHYGKFYVERKKHEIELNESGAFAEQAAKILTSKKFGKDTEAYKAYSQGKLPDGHIHARAKRHTVKLWLSHVWQVMYEDHYNMLAPFPYVITHLGHVDIIPLSVPFKPA